MEAQAAAGLLGVGQAEEALEDALAHGWRDAGPLSATREHTSAPSRPQDSRTVPPAGV